MSLLRSLIHWPGGFYKDSSPTDFAAFVFFAQNDFKRPLPRSSTPNYFWLRNKKKQPPLLAAVGVGDEGIKTIARGFSGWLGCYRLLPLTPA